MPFLLASILTVLSAAAANFSSPKSVPRLPAAPGALLSAVLLLLGIGVLASTLSLFSALLSVLTVWMIALPVIGVMRAVRLHG